MEGECEECAGVVGSVGEGFPEAFARLQGDERQRTPGPSARLLAMAAANASIENGVNSFIYIGKSFYGV